MFEQRVLAQIDWVRKKSEAENDSTSSNIVEEDHYPGDGDEGSDEEMMAFTPSSADEPPEEEDEVTRSDKYLQQLADIRRLFNRAIAINKYHSASWIGWAKFEQRYGSDGEIYFYGRCCPPPGPCYLTLFAVDVARKLLITGISNFPTSKNIAWFHSALGSVYLQQAKGSNVTATSSSGLSQARACYQRGSSHCMG